MSASENKDVERLDDLVRRNQGHPHFPMETTEKDIIEDAEQRPWGMYRVLLVTPYTKVKEIVVNPNQRLSLQYHRYRSEVWTVVKGDGTVELGNDTGLGYTLDSLGVLVGDIIEVAKAQPHRITAGGDGITFIEVQLSPSGIFSEDDIVRLKDDYGRIEE